MAVTEELVSLIKEPRESLAVELKDWLDLSNPNHKAKIVKAIIGLQKQQRWLSTYWV
jgi:hypothetical protein